MTSPKGQAALKPFYDHIAEQIQAPENNGYDGLLGELIAEQRKKMGLIE